MALELVDGFFLLCYSQLLAANCAFANGMPSADGTVPGMAAFESALLRVAIAPPAQALHEWQYVAEKALVALCHWD